MAWQRSGDTGASHPAIMGTRRDKTADERTINEVAGFIWRLSLQSAAHLTDYLVEVGTIEMIGGPRWEELVRLALKTGLLTRVKGQPGVYRLIEDPDLIHIRSKADVEWGRRQRDDANNIHLVVQVRRRDGDNCRWCGVEVVWRGKKTKRSGELDHLVPGEAATLETYVVACRGCNSGRGGNHEAWDSAHELRPAPTRPRYGQWTAQLLSDNGYPTEPSDEPQDDDVRPAPAQSADTAPQSVRPATAQSDDPAPAPGVRAKYPPNSGGSEFGGLSERVSPGRDGTGLGLGTGLGQGSGGDGPGMGEGQPPPGARRRGRRGRRGGGAPGV